MEAGTLTSRLNLFREPVTRGRKPLRRGGEQQSREILSVSKVSAQAIHVYMQLAF